MVSLYTRVEHTLYIGEQHKQAAMQGLTVRAF